MQSNAFLVECFVFASSEDKQFAYAHFILNDGRSKLETFSRSIPIKMTNWKKKDEDGE